ncbi:XRE family transcriptional regulator [Streptomyces bauhiniae]|uniref:helix-turn-helix domain-containing protein n=1 Tax=Streptomyces bauhiniae TaxID=2340725 RepID=UPI00331A05FB
METIDIDRRTHVPDPTPGTMELHQLLRLWRAEAGTRSRRRKALPQKEVALRIGVSERWYRSVEAGDSVSLSSDVLGRISRVLALGPDERMVLYSRALKGVDAVPDESVEPESHAELLQLVTAQTQFPAYLTDGAWNILGHNTLMATWFPWVREAGANLMLWTLTAPAAREQILDWHEHAEVFLAMLRFATATNSPCKAPLEEVLRNVLEDPDCRRLWPQTQKFVAFRQGHQYHLSLPHLSTGQITVTSRVLLPAYHRGLRCVILVPQNLPH